MQFNLLSLFLATTVVAVFMAVLFALPAFFAGALTFFLIGAIPTILSCGVYFGTGRTKAFCLGAFLCGICAVAGHNWFATRPKTVESP